MLKFSLYLRRHSPMFSVDTCSSMPSVPTTDGEAIHLPQATQWKQDTQNELSSCTNNNVWSELMHLPPSHKSAKLGFIYAIESSSDVAFPIRYQA